MRRLLHVAMTRARKRLVLAYPERTDRGAAQQPVAVRRGGAAAVGGEWEEREEELFGPAETLQSTFRMLRDELLTTVAQVGGRLGELRFDTDLDVSHAVVRYLELLKLARAAGAHRAPAGQSVAEALPEVNARLLQAATAEQREIFETSALDEYLLDAERDEKLRARAVAARAEPSLEPFLPRRGDGLLLSASDIETYRTCPLKYKFARVFRIPQEPTLNQRFGILVHQVLERFHAGATLAQGLPELLGLLEAGWRRGGFGDSEEERQLRAKATQALMRYHERFQERGRRAGLVRALVPVQLGPHVLRGRVDRVDRLPDGAYELIDYKTGPPEDRRAAARGRPALALRGRRARGLAARGRPPGLLLRARRREGPGRARRRGPRLDHRDRARGRRGHPRRASSRRRRTRPARCATTGSPARPPSARLTRVRAAMLPDPRWRRKRWNSRAMMSPEGSVARLRGGLLLVGGALEALDEGLDLGIALDGEGDLALVVDGRGLELDGVDGHADEALEPPHERQRALRVGRHRDVVRHRGPQRGGRHARARRTRRGGRRRCRSGPRRSAAAGRAARSAPGRTPWPVMETGRVCGTSASSAPMVTTICTPSASASSITVAQNVRQRMAGSGPLSRIRSRGARGTRAS